jgi:hypothetical protein
MAAFAGDCRRWGGLGLLGLILCAAAAAPVSAQAPAADAPTYYVPNRSFRVPFTYNPGDRRQQRFLLYVSQDNGRTWTYAATANPADGSFLYTAQHEGWFWFAVQTQDADGRYSPETSALQAGLKVCVDTLKPLVTLRPVAPREGTVAVEWDVQDENLDALSLRLDYRPAGSRNEADWRPVRVPAVPRGEQGWTPPGNVPLEVRLQVLDKAKNVGEAVTALTPGVVRPGAAAEATGTVIHVKSRTFRLNFSIDNRGDSGVQGIEVWVTRDTRIWQQHSAQAKPSQANSDKYSLPLEVKSPGRWGFTLLPRSGVGLSEQAPRPGDQPQVWVEVDETRPVVTLTNVVVGQGADLGKVTIYWSASDTFLKAKPITISWAEQATGPWTVLEQNLEHTGVYNLDTKGRQLPFQFYVKVDAVDEAGNVGSAQTNQPVKVDTKIPKAINIQIGPAEAQPAGDGRGS